MSETTLIREVDEDEFATAVLAASQTRPVVVDFWAPWCGPCHQLSPLLEKAAAQHADAVTVVKVNIDEAPGIARDYRIQGIPAVKAFRDGRVVSEFTGVQPEAAIERFFVALGPSVADGLVVQAQTAPVEEREGLLREALAHAPGHAEATRLLAALSLGAAESGDLDLLRDRARSGAAEDRLALGRGLVAAGDHAEGLEVLLEAVRDPATRDAARQVMLEVFLVLGEDHDLVRTTRPRLARVLF